MAIVGISEFTFGFAFLYEQTHAQWGNLQAAPVLPNLQQEQQQGWDANLPLNGIDFYYQFILSDYLWRSNAKFIADGTYNGPYYRIALHRKNNNQSTSVFGTMLSIIQTPTTSRRNLTLWTNLIRLPSPTR